MFGIDSPELLVIAIVAIIVIGPKELPGLLRTWGRWMSQMRGMAAEFRGHVDEMVRQSELDQVKKQIESNTSDLDLHSLDPTKEIKNAIQEGMAEGDKALAEAKSSLESPLAEPDSAPQVGAEAAAEPAALPALAAANEAAADETEPASPAEVPGEVLAEARPVLDRAEQKPAKAAAE